MLDWLTESPTLRLPCGSPLDLLSDREYLVFMAKARRRNMSRIAKTLGISRETLYVQLRSAWATLDRTLRERGGGPLCRRCLAEPPLRGRRIGRHCRSVQQATSRISEAKEER